MWYYYIAWQKRCGKLSNHKMHECKSNYNCIQNTNEIGEEKSKGEESKKEIKKMSLLYFIAFCLYILISPPILYKICKYLVIFSKRRSWLFALKQSIKKKVWKTTATSPRTCGWRVRTWRSAGAHTTNSSNGVQVLQNHRKAWPKSSTTSWAHGQT